MLDDLHSNHKSIKCYADFTQSWNKYKSSKYPLFKALMGAFKSDILFCMFVKLVCSTCDIIQPIVIKKVIGYVSLPERDLEEGVWIILLVFGVKLINIFFDTHN